MSKRTPPVAFGPALFSGFLLLLLLLASVVPLGLAGSAAPAARPAAAQQTDVPLLYSSAPDQPDAGLQAILDDNLSGLKGNWAAVVKKLDTGQYAAVNTGTQAETASLYKLFVFYEVMRQRLAGQLSLDEVLPITRENAAYDIQIGELHWILDDQVKISALVDKMITVSDNTAAVTLARRVGIDNVNASLRRLGLTHSSLDFSAGGVNRTTAADYTHLLEMIATGQVLDRESCRYIVDVMLRQQINNWLPVGVPEEVPIAHKTGTLENLTHDAGIVYAPNGPYVIIVMSWNLPDITVPNWFIPQISRQVYKYLSGRSFQPARYFPETRQVVGPAFLLYYNTHGGEATFGQPLAAETQQGDAVVQLFERARMERPAAGGDVTLGKVGSELTAAQNRRFDPTPKADPNDPNTLWFADTRQAIGQPFLTYWREHGGQEIFGLPLSNIVVEQQDGQPVRVQYFERARFELHGDRITLGRLGAELQALQR